MEIQFSISGRDFGFGIHIDASKFDFGVGHVRDGAEELLVDDLASGMHWIVVYLKVRSHPII